MSNSILVVIPHPDDEVIGLYTYLKDMHRNNVHIHILYVTDGAPCESQRTYPIHGYDSMNAYSQARRDESMNICRSIGSNVTPIYASFVDSELINHVHEVYTYLLNVITALKPDHMLFPLLQGGHPDHDVLSILSYRINEYIDIPTSYYGLYALVSDEVVFNGLDNDPKNLARKLSAQECVKKYEALAMYKSQINHSQILRKYLNDLKCGSASELISTPKSQEWPLEYCYEKLFRVSDKQLRDHAWVQSRLQDQGFFRRVYLIRKATDED